MMSLLDKKENGKSKLDVAVERLQSFEPKDGYYLAFSGGKDSQCIYHLAKLAGVQFDAHYNVTGIDPPEVVRFIKFHYPDVKFEIPTDKDGNRVTMWSLIEKNGMLPTRFARFCCASLKEGGGDGRFVITGVRWAESVARRNAQAVNVRKRGYVRGFVESGNFAATDKGHIYLINDNTESRRMLERCVVRGKVTINPILEWSDADVWEFLNDVARVPHCSLYDEGRERIGCIGCPMQNPKKRIEQLERWPEFKRLYYMAVENAVRHNPKTRYETAEEMLSWWLGGENYTWHV